MISFENDYNTGAHPKILEQLIKTNLEQLSGYGTDVYSESAKEKIKKACGCANAEIHFLGGGTQTNSVVISALLKSYEGVICAATGHINTHEAGAIEYTGHKVLPLPEHFGKIDADELLKYLSDFFTDTNHEHAVFPGMVYISYPTEYGTLYTKEELSKIYGICQQYGLPLYIDGARLGYGLASNVTDLTLYDIAHLSDAFYIGGTKVGALCGEAVVFPKGNAPIHFMTIIKQHGALFAKGRLCGVQFDTLFTDNLYFEISKHAIKMSENLKELLKEKNYRFFLESPTNQQFVILEDDKYKKLKENVALSFWEKYDENHTVVRFATSWSTTQDDLEELKKLL